MPWAWTSCTITLTHMPNLEIQHCQGERTLDRPKVPSLFNRRQLSLLPQLQRQRVVLRCLMIECLKGLPAPNKSLLGNLSLGISTQHMSMKLRELCPPGCPRSSFDHVAWLPKHIGICWTGCSGETWLVLCMCLVHHELKRIVVVLFLFLFLFLFCFCFCSCAYFHSCFLYQYY